MKVDKNFLLNSMGIFLIVLGSIRLIQLIFFGEPVHIFWLCNHIIVLMGIAILFRSSFWLTAEFCFLFIGQLVWVIAILLYFAFGIVLPGSSAYLLYDGVFINLISILVHFLTLPIGFWAILLIRKKEKFAWVGALIHALVLVPFVLYFGSKYNLNCFYEPCLSFVPNVGIYSFLVIPVYFLIFVIPINYLVNWILGKVKPN